MGGSLKPGPPHSGIQAWGWSRTPSGRLNTYYAGYMFSQGKTIPILIKDNRDEAATQSIYYLTICCFGFPAEGRQIGFELALFFRSLRSMKFFIITFRIDT